MNRPSSTLKLTLFVVLIISIAGCNDGWESMGDNIKKRLIAVGDCSPAIKDATYFIIETEYSVSAPPALKSDGHHTIFYHNLNDKTLLPWEDSLHWRIKQELLGMNCGDAMVISAPIHAVNKTFLCGFNDLPSDRGEDLIEVNFKIMKTFDEQGYRDYLLSSAQHGEIAETEAIELLLMNNTEIAYEKHGDCFIQPLIVGAGDTIAVGSEVTIAYTTSLLNDKPLDKPTELQFTFGRPDQVVEGLQYALSMMRCGDEAYVYLPSYLAFGEEGSTGGVVPPKTPVCFKLKVVDVKK